MAGPVDRPGPGRLRRVRGERHGGGRCGPRIHLRHGGHRLSRDAPGRTAARSRAGSTGGVRGHHVSEHAELVWYGDDAPWYDHGPQHPLRPARVILTRQLIHDFGIVDGRRVVETSARDATDDEIELVHTADYIEATKRAGQGENGDWWRFGYGPGDNPIFPQMHEASARVVGASLVAAEAGHSGRAEHAFNPAGGLHHAMPSRASGFCVYDDPALAIAWMLANGAERIAYVDVDVHHGDGPQAIFFRDARVLTISIHQDGRTLFPGTGFIAGG